MKKLIGALALAAMVATSAFAEVSFGAWLCALPTIVGFDGEDVKGAGISNPWGYGARTARLDINWTSDDGKAGMTMGVYNDAANGLGASDAADFWIKPVDAVQITVGQMDNFTGLRGDLCYGSWNWLRPNTWKVEDEGLTFSGISDLGLGIQLFPVEGLQVFASLPMTEVSGKSSAALSRMDKAFGNGKIGAAYTIDGIGTIKAQFLGKYDINAAKAAVTGAVGANSWYTTKNNVRTQQTTYDDAITAVKSDTDGKTTMDFTTKALDATTAADENKRYGTIEAAFDLTAVDKLFVTIGGAFTIADKDWFVADAGSQEQIKLALGASYGITEAFKLSASFAMLKYHSDVADDPVFQFGVGGDYAINDVLGVVADVRMLLPNNDADPTLSFLVGLNGAVGSNASLGLGFQGIVGLGDKATKGDLKVVQATEADKFAFAVPIRASIWF